MVSNKNKKVTLQLAMTKHSPCNWVAQKGLPTQNSEKQQQQRYGGPEVM